MNDLWPKANHMTELYLQKLSHFKLFRLADQVEKGVSITSGKSTINVLVSNFVCIIRTVGLQIFWNIVRRNVIQVNSIRTAKNTRLSILLKNKFMLLYK